MQRNEAMAQKDQHSETSATSSPLNVAPVDLAEMGKKRIEATNAVQSELIDKLQDMNREWLARAQSEVDLASELTTKLTAARSFPDAVTACQEWASKRMNMFAEDGRRVLADTQRLVKTGARLFSNGVTGSSA